MNVKLKLQKAAMAFTGVVFGLMMTATPILWANESTVTGALNQESSKVVTKDDGVEYTAADLEYYKSSYGSIKEVVYNGFQIQEEEQKEGTVLLKNDNNALPLAKGSNVSVFGVAGAHPFYGASGSGGINKSEAINWYDAFAGYEHSNPDAPKEKVQGDVLLNVNPGLKEDYDVWGKPGQSGWTGTTPGGPYASASSVSQVVIGDAPWNVVQTSDGYGQISQYGDAAIYIISRSGGEGYDLPATSGEHEEYGNVGNSHISSNDGTNGDYLQLSPTEISVLEGLQELKKAGTVKKVVLILNMASTIQLDFLKENTYDIDACLWTGSVGEVGTVAVAKLLTGEYNFSGGASATLWADHLMNPVNNNFMDQNYFFTYEDAYDGEHYYDQADVALTTQYQSSFTTYTVYQEGMYLGYRYTETRYEDYVLGTQNVGEYNYEDVVAYPFGYGLSYTTFEWDVNFKTAELDVNGDVVVDVTVTNTGDVAGKDVVELYYSAPYTEYEIEKSHVVLGGYEKTDLIQPGMSDTVTITMSVRTMASYDYNDANANGIEGYELDDGDYTIYVGKNSHVWADADAASKVYTLEDEHYYETDEVSGTKVENQFDYMSDYFDENADSTFAGHSKLMSRTDFEGTFPQPPTTEEAQISSAEQSGYAYSAATPAYDEGQPWYSDEMPEQAAVTEGRISATRMVGLDYDDPRWDTFMNQLSLSDMRDMIVSGYFWTIEIPELDIPQSITPDGPTGFVQGSGSNWVGNTCFYASPIVVASTWNKELAREMP